MRRLALAVALISVVATPADASTSAFGTVITFHGWSPDSHAICWTESKTVRPRAGRKARTAQTHHHRRVEEGLLAARLPGPDTRDPGGWTADRGYRHKALSRRTVKDHNHWFTAPEGTYEIVIDVGKRLVWELRFDGKAIVRQAFDQLYVSMMPSVFLSPDRRHLVVLMEVDTGWAVDASLSVVALPSYVRERWIEVNEALGEAVTRGQR